MTRDLGAYQSHGLFSWRKDEWLGLRWWAMALKNKEHPAFWREPALWALDTFGRPEPGTVFVPVPSSGRDFNHALGFARALAHWSGRAVADVLRTTAGRGHQRRLSLFARRRRRYQVLGDPPRGPVIIVDDVITSGATAEAAFRALGQPADARVWCVMDRRPPGSTARV